MRRLQYVYDRLSGGRLYHDGGKNQRQAGDVVESIPETFGRREDGADSTAGACVSGVTAVQIENL